MATRKTSGKTISDRTLAKQRSVQAQVEKSEKKKSGSKKEQPVQAGPRKHPTPEKQHQPKPGIEAKLHPRPQYMAPDYKGSGKLQDKAAIITGADSGIGRAVAVLFAREGADVAIVYLSADEDAAETKRAVEGEGRRCLVIKGDVKDPEFCRDAVDQTVREFGGLDVLVNNAAFQEHASSIEELTEEHFDLTVKTNLYGYFHMTKAAVPHLKNGSAIINTSSETALFGQEELIDYSATKGAINALTMSLAQSLGKKGIRVNAVAPGPVWTPLNPADRPADKVEEFGSQNLMKRPAQPEELSPVYVFLASPVCSSYVNGAIYPVMGGPMG